MPKPQHVDENLQVLFFQLVLSHRTRPLTDHLNNTRYEIMMKCWKNDPHTRPTFTELKNQLKDMETQHKVRILINIKKFFT